MVVNFLVVFSSLKGVFARSAKARTAYPLSFVVSLSLRFSSDSSRPMLDA